VTSTAPQGFSANHTSSNRCGVTLITGYPSMIRVDGERVLTFDFDEISKALGFDFDQSDFEEIMSTHYGRMVHLDDRTMLFANPEDAAEYIDFDLTPVD
jgi:propane monooxygenase coupling protein